MSPGADSAARFRAVDGLRLVGALAVMMTHVGFDSGTPSADRSRGCLGASAAGSRSSSRSRASSSSARMSWLTWTAVPGPGSGRTSPAGPPASSPVLWLGGRGGMPARSHQGGRHRRLSSHRGPRPHLRRNPAPHRAHPVLEPRHRGRLHLVLPVAAALLCRGPSGMTWFRRAGVVAAPSAPGGPGLDGRGHRDRAPPGAALVARLRRLVRRPGCSSRCGTARGPRD